ncbi:MAG: D-tyrosyl-tRNA(Tyr) deacylase [Candidatus Cloacimonetes bacterium]|nr:D-tyrosyl-tRNA(Tyr) deacylase [Candidatus Cloacimonadota bacterium]
MKIVLQRVNFAELRIDGKLISSIEKGLLVFLGIGKNDSTNEIEWLSNKICNLRIFAGDNGKMNLSVKDIKGEILLVSQFTLYANTSRGRRPDFIDAAKPEMAEKLYVEFAEQLAIDGIQPKTGIFGADMKIKSENDGPVTIIIEK